MTNSPASTVSVVMPTYNRADLLPQSIASILSQDFDDFELLIVDDGSTDDTAEVIGRIQEKDSRLRYRKLPENRGIGFARNTGLQHVSGKYIAPADSDDLWLPGKLKAQVEVMHNHPEIEILFGDFWNIDHLKGTRASAFDLEQAGLKQLTVRHVSDDLHIVEDGFEIGMLRKVFVQLGTVLLRADVLKRVGGFDINLSGPEDFEFCWRAAVLGAQYAYLDRPLIERHKVKSSVTANLSVSLMGVLDALQKCRQTCETVQRLDLLTHIHATEHRVRRNLIREYSDKGDRASIWRVFRESLRRGFSALTFAFFIIGMIGPQAMSLALVLRARSLRLSWKFLEANG